MSREAWGLELSRYVHLNPVRVKALGLGKAERGRSRQGVGGKPNEEVVRERIGRLRAYRWSSYRAYIGLERRPEWLECEEVRSLGGWRKEKNLAAKNREYVETAVREGLKVTPWESLRDQVILGPREFWEKLKQEVKEKGKSGERMERLMPGRPDWKRVVECVEKVKGEKWELFRDRHGDSGRDLAVHVARREGGMTLKEIGRQAGLKSDAAVAVTLSRYAQRLRRKAEERRQLAEVMQMLGVRS